MRQYLREIAEGVSVDGDDQLWTKPSREQIPPKTKCEVEGFTLAPKGFVGGRPEGDVIRRQRRFEQGIPGRRQSCAFVEKREDSCRRGASGLCACDYRLWTGESVPTGLGV